MDNLVTGLITAVVTFVVTAFLMAMLVVEGQRSDVKAGVTTIDKRAYRLIPIEPVKP